MLGASDAEDALVAVDDFFADPEAEARAGYSLGAVEGFEETREGFWGHAGASVGYGEDEAWTIGWVVVGFASTEEEAATSIVHGIGGVDEKVIDDLADFTVEAEDGAVGSLAHVEGNVGVEEAAAEDGEDVAEEVVDGDMDGAAGLAVEAEGLGGDGGGSTEFLFGEGEVLECLGVDGAGLGEEEEVGDGLEGIIDFVGDGGGEAADGGEFFGAEESGLCALAFGNVFDDDDHAEGAVGFLEGSAAGADPTDFAVGGAEDAVLAFIGSVMGGGGAELSADEFAVVGMDELDPIIEVAGGLGRAEHVEHGWVAGGEVGGGVVGPGAEAGGFERELEALFAAAQSLFDELAIGNVADGAAKLDDPAGGVEDGFAARGQPDGSAIAGKVHFDVELVGLTGGDALVHGGLEASVAFWLDDGGIGGVVEDGEAGVVLHDAVDFFAPGELAGGEDEAPGAHFADAFGLAEIACAIMQLDLCELGTGDVLDDGEHALGAVFGDEDFSFGANPTDALWVEDAVFELIGAGAGEGSGELFATGATVVGMETLLPEIVVAGGCRGSEHLLHARVGGEGVVLRVVGPGAELGSLEGELEAIATAAEFALGKDAIGGLGAGDQDADNLAFGIANGTVAPGPVDVLEAAIAKDGDELIFVPGGFSLVQDEIQAELDVIPDLGPAFASGLTESGGVADAGAEGGTVGVVVELDGVRTPPKKHGVMRGEEEIYAGEEGIVPGVDGAERCGGPIKGTDKVGHFAGAEDAAGGRCGRVVRCCKSA